ncbi:hypothetical protein [Ferrimonas balearica]|uniref:hypothetical protein n=1 Tax=Ferrimonas balearica TaxID=44012 RepID=UPI001C99EE09|nr:hypothetical protein [Ferrimonas balearica]MBY5921626.1 hypothetical protein [Ferrimonas balearica]MBY5995034.1 hypothetical protein [Ferrimonas balearica]
MGWGNLLGKMLRDGVLEKGLIETVKPQVQPAVDEIRTATGHLLTESGLKGAPDPATHPKEALQYQLSELVACLLQTPRSQAYYLMDEMVGLVPSVLAAHPKLGGLLGLAQAMGIQLGRPGSGQGQAAVGLSSMLGGGRMAQTLARSGQAMLDGQQAYEVHASQARDWDSLTPLQQQVVEQCSLLAALLESTPEQEGAQRSAHRRAIEDAINVLENVLNRQDDALFEGLGSEHRSRLAALIGQPMTRHS